MKGNPNFKVGDKVCTVCNYDGKLEIIQGEVFIVDPFGTWDDDSNASYDIMATTERYPEGCLFKHFNECSVTDSLYDLRPIINNRVNKIYPFMQYDENNEYCNGNCEPEGWFMEVPTGWMQIALDFLYKLKKLLIEYDYLDKFQVHQVKEKWGVFEFYHDWIDNDELRHKVQDLCSELRKISHGTCIHCGTQPTTHYTTGYLTYICGECAKDKINVRELRKKHD